MLLKMKDESEKEVRPWSDLPPELLELILQRLPSFYHPYFELVCKRWKQVTSPLYGIDRAPLLVHFKTHGDGICRYYSPGLNKVFLLDCPHNLSNSELCLSRDGWLLFYRGYEVILFNPITRISRTFPGLHNENNYQCISFGGCPCRDDFVIFSIDCRARSYALISTCTGKQWTLYRRHKNNLPFAMADNTNPVFWRGHFYCLGIDGNLGVYSPKTKTWTILPRPQHIISAGEEIFLVEPDGHDKLLMAVFRNYKPLLQVFMFHPCKKTWEKIENLGSQTLFFGFRASLLSTPMGRRMSNRVYFRWIHGKPETVEAEVEQCEGRILFIPKARQESNSRRGESTCYSYSLKDGENSEYVGAKEILNSIWFQPRVSQDCTCGKPHDECLTVQKNSSHIKNIGQKNDAGVQDKDIPEALKNI